MTKKPKALSGSDDNQLAEAVRASAQQIWQAGLGAFAKAQQEGGQVFAKLVDEGSELQKRTRKLSRTKASDVTDTVTRLADSIGKRASGTWDKLEQVFEDRVARSLASLDVPTRDEIRALTRRIEELDKAVAALTGRKASSSGTASAKTAATKAAAKPASAKKPAARAATKKAAPQRTVTKKPVARKSTPAKS